MSLGLKNIRDVWKFDRLITIQWLMKILLELYNFKDEDLRCVLKRFYLFGGATWDEIEKNPEQAAIVLFAFMRLLARNDAMLEGMIESFINGNAFDAYEKAEKFFEYLKKVYGESMFFQSVHIS